MWLRYIRSRNVQSTLPAKCPAPALEMHKLMCHFISALFYSIANTKVDSKSTYLRKSDKENAMPFKFTLYLLTHMAAVTLDLFLFVKAAERPMPVLRHVSLLDANNYGCIFPFLN